MATDTQTIRTMATRRSTRAGAGVSRHYMPQEDRDRFDWLRANAGKASTDAVSMLQIHGAIETRSYSVRRHCNIEYPLEYTGPRKCSRRALHCISNEAAKYVHENDISRLNDVLIKNILERYVAKSDGAVFYLRKWDNTQHHWVAISREYYYDEAVCYKVLNYEKASHLLDFLENVQEDDFGGLNSYINPDQLDALYRRDHPIGGTDNSRLDEQKGLLSDEKKTV